MALKAKSNVTDNLHIKVYRDGKLIDERITEPRSGFFSHVIKIFRELPMLNWFVRKWCPDDVVTAGIGKIQDLVKAGFSYVEIGIGDTAVTAADVTLESGVESRVEASKSTATTTVTNDTAVFAGAFTMTGDHLDSGSGAIRECGLFTNAESGGDDVMLCRQVFESLNLRTGDTITFEWRIQFASA